MNAEITPELIQALIRMGGLDEQDLMLGDEMKRVQQYEQPQGNPYAGAPSGAAPIGALMYGLGDVLRSGIGAYQRHGIRAKQEANTEARSKGRDAYAQALVAALMGGGGPAAGAALTQPSGTPASAGAIPGMGAQVPDLEQQIQALFMPGGRRAVMPRVGGSGG